MNTGSTVLKLALLENGYLASVHSDSIKIWNSFDFSLELTIKIDSIFALAALPNGNLVGMNGLGIKYGIQKLAR